MPADEPASCIICHRELVPYTDWTGATKTQRAAWRAEGKANPGRADMCATCRMRLKRNGQLDQYPTTVKRHRADIDGDNPWTCCRRCGHGDVHTGVLCQDCVEVTGALREADRWAA